MIEMIIVLILTMILAAYAVFRWPDRAIDVYNVAYQLASYLRTAQQNAMSQNAIFQVKIQNSSYGIYYSGNPTNTTLFDISVTLPNGISKCSCTASSANVCYVAFDKLGLPYSYNGTAGYSALVSNYSINLCATDGKSKVVIINSAGWVSVN